MSKAAKYSARFLESMETSGRALYNRTVGFVRRLDADGEGALIRTPNNIDLLLKLSAEYSEFFQSATYQQRLGELLQAPEVILAEVTQAFIDREGFVPAPLIEEAKQIANRYLYELEDILQSDRPEQEITGMAVNDLYHGIGAHKDADAVIDDYRDTEDDLRSYFSTKVVVLVEQLERDLNMNYGRYYGVKEWRYVGPEDEKNRDFCADRVGGTFTEDEVRAWASEDWAGKIPGTNAANIFTNCGGFNCRHVLEPV